MPFYYDMEDEYPLGNQCLTDITNLKQLHKLLLMVSMLNSGGYYWIGLSDHEIEGTFKWTDGTLLTDTGWGTWYYDACSSPPCGQYSRFFLLHLFCNKLH